jgi:assimilatory nitrate reductase catalytic subunit
VHPDTAAAHGITDGDPVRVTTRRGTTVLAARVVRTIRPDTVFVPYHWAPPIAANQLTISRFDPTSGIPNYKACAVKIERSAEPATPVTPPPVATGGSDA